MPSLLSLPQEVVTYLVRRWLDPWDVTRLDIAACSSFDRPPLFFALRGHAFSGFKLRFSEPDCRLSCLLWCARRRMTLESIHLEATSDQTRALLPLLRTFDLESIQELQLSESRSTTASHNSMQYLELLIDELPSLHRCIIRAEQIPPLYLPTDRLLSLEISLLREHNIAAFAGMCFPLLQELNLSGNADLESRILHILAHTTPNLVAFTCNLFLRIESTPVRSDSPPSYLTFQQLERVVYRASGERSPAAVIVETLKRSPTLKDISLHGTAATPQVLGALYFCLGKARSMVERVHVSTQSLRDMEATVFVDSFYPDLVSLPISQVSTPRASPPSSNRKSPLSTLHLQLHPLHAKYTTMLLQQLSSVNSVANASLRSLTLSNRMTCVNIFYSHRLNLFYLQHLVTIRCLLSVEDWIVALQLPNLEHWVCVVAANDEQSERLTQAFRHHLRSLQPKKASSGRINSLPRLQHVDLTVQLDSDNPSYAESATSLDSSDFEDMTLAQALLTYLSLSSLQQQQNQSSFQLKTLRLHLSSNMAGVDPHLACSLLATIPSLRKLDINVWVMRKSPYFTLLPASAPLQLSLQCIYMTASLYTMGTAANLLYTLLLHSDLCRSVYITAVSSSALASASLLTISTRTDCTVVNTDKFDDPTLDSSSASGSLSDDYDHHVVEDDLFHALFPTVWWHFGHLACTFPRTRIFYDQRRLQAFGGLQKPAMTLTAWQEQKEHPAQLSCTIS